jgi:16S rRNA (cytosine1402-N4)-methyltransferase
MNIDAKPFHKSVLVKEVLTYLNPGPDKVYLDATFGGGGHSRAILENSPQSNVIGLDWDAHTIETQGLPVQQQFPDRFRIIWGNFAHLYKILSKEGIDKLDGILADFGTSQYQLTSAAGFSFNTDTPLDMRMSPSHQKITAAEILNKSSEEKLRDIFFTLGQERHAKMIAAAIVAERKRKPFKTTRQLASLIEKITPRGQQRIHPATRVFQALRMFINHELENIRAFLPAAVSAIKPGGRLVVITFHSLEDHLVKHFFKTAAQENKVTILTEQPIGATDEEVSQNPSSRSAKLRAVEIL